VGICVDFSLILAPWHIWAQWHFPHYFRYVRSEWLGHLRGLTDETHDFLGAPAYQFVILHLAWWFPWSMALLPGIILAWRRVLRPREISFADGLLFCWMGVIFVPLLFLGQRTRLLFDEYVERVRAVGSHGLDRTPQSLRAAGAVAVGVIGLILAGWGAVRGACHACFERNLGSDGRSLDRMESLERYACVRVGSTAAHTRDYGCLIRVLLDHSALLHFQTTRETGGHCPGCLDDSSRAQHGSRRRENRAVFLTRRRRSLPESAVGDRRPRDVRRPAGRQQQPYFLSQSKILFC